MIYSTEGRSPDAGQELVRNEGGTDTDYIWVLRFRLETRLGGRIADPNSLAQLLLDSFFIIAKSNSSQSFIDLIFLLILSIHVTLILSYPHIFTFIFTHSLSFSQNALVISMTSDRNKEAIYSYVGGQSSSANSKVI